MIHRLSVCLILLIAHATGRLNVNLLQIIDKYNVPLKRKVPTPFMLLKNYLYPRYAKSILFICFPHWFTVRRITVDVALNAAFHDMLALWQCYSICFNVLLSNYSLSSVHRNEA